MEVLRGKRTFHAGTTTAVSHEVANYILHGSIAGHYFFIRQDLLHCDG
jgi:hypothetical protein